jgi:hypothetical protein
MAFKDDPNAIALGAAQIQILAQQPKIAFHPVPRLTLP